METLRFAIPKANYHSTLDVPSNELNTLVKVDQNCDTNFEKIQGKQLYLTIFVRCSTGKGTAIAERFTDVN